MYIHKALSTYVLRSILIVVSRNIWWIFDEFLKMFKGVNLGSNLKNAIEIQRTTVLSTWRCFKPKETRLHKPSLSWQAIANLLIFCVLRLPWSPGTSWQPLWAVSYAPSALQTDILPRSSRRQLQSARARIRVLCRDWVAHLLVLATCRMPVSSLGGDLSGK